MKLLFTAAHHGFELGRVPLGGGAAICHRLEAEWSKTRPFDFEILDPRLMGSSAPKDKDLVCYSEIEYARFCLAFERVLTERIFREDPRECVVLTNDISEGPDFRALAQKGFAIFPIYHVDVVDYVTTTYLKGLVKPERLARAYAAIDSPSLRKVLPKIASLIFAKQQDSVTGSRALLVPSQGMRDVFARCYPKTAPQKTIVLPWGASDDQPSPAEVEVEKTRCRDEWKLVPERPVLLMLSRLSPEKRQDRLLRALLEWEGRTDYPSTGLCVIVAGEAAFMNGKKFERRLRDWASKLRKTQVLFAGFAAGVRKRALFELATLYLFPSEHESYGLTLLESLQAGTPALATFSHGAREVLRKDCGVLMPAMPDHRIPSALRERLQTLLSDRLALQRMGACAKAFAATQTFSDTARRLAALLENAVPVARATREPIHE